MHLPVYPLILVVCFGTALTIALPQQTPNSGQNPQDPFNLYGQIPQEKWPRYKGVVIDPQCILTDLRKNHHKREWPAIPKPVYPAPGYCPAWPQNTETNTETETETDREDRELCGEGFEPRCCTGQAFGFGLGTMISPCYQYMTPKHCTNVLKGETYCCEKFTAIPLDGTFGINCRPVTFVSLPSSPTASSSLIDNTFADANPIPGVLLSSSSSSSSSSSPSDASNSDQEFYNSAAAAPAVDWAADATSGNSINIAASNANLIGFNDAGVVNPF